MSDIKTVLFVCTGNSCRSVMAEGLLKKYLKGLGKDIEVMSAGTVAVAGLPPTEPTINVMKDEGVDVSGFCSKRLTADLIKKADLILTMQSLHKKEVIRMAPEAAKKTYLLKEYPPSGRRTSSEDIDVPDPIGQPLDAYKNNFEVIKKEIERIARIL